jgi:hypothetical protein
MPLTASKTQETGGMTLEVYAAVILNRRESLLISEGNKSCAQKKYNHHCPSCNKETPHFSVVPGPVRIAVYILKKAIFKISLGEAYHYTLSAGGDAFGIQCTNCHARSTISYV